MDLRPFVAWSRICAMGASRIGLSVLRVEQFRGCECQNVRKLLTIACDFVSKTISGLLKVAEFSDGRSID